MRSRNPSSPFDSIRWNHNIEYHSVILDALANTVGRVLDASSAAPNLNYVQSDVLVAAIGTHVLRRRRTYWEHSAPMVWPPPETFAGCRRIGGSTLPGVRYRRHLLWRYSLVWTKPSG